MSAGLRAYNALFNKAKFTEIDSIMIVNASTNCGYVSA